MKNNGRRLSKREILAIRTYRFNYEGSEYPLTVRIWRPRKVRGEPRYECAVEIAGWGKTRVRAFNGVDAFEALQLALIVIGTDVKHISEQVSGPLTWSEGARQDLAFPVYPDYSLIPIMKPNASDASAPDRH